MRYMFTSPVERVTDKGQIEQGEKVAPKGALNIGVIHAVSFQNMDCAASFENG